MRQQQNSSKTAQETIKKMQRMPTEQQKIFPNNISIKGLLSKYTITQIAQPQENNFIKKWAEDLNRHFSKNRSIQLTNRHRKKMLSIINHQENANQNHNIISYLSKWDLSKRQQIRSVGKDVEKREPSCTLVRMLIGSATRKNSMAIPQKNKFGVPYYPAIPLQGISLRDQGIS